MISGLDMEWAQPWSLHRASSRRLWVENVRSGCEKDENAADTVKWRGLCRAGIWDWNSFAFTSWQTAWFSRGQSPAFWSWLRESVTAKQSTGSCSRVCCACSLIFRLEICSFICLCVRLMSFCSCWNCSCVFCLCIHMYSDSVKH